jgi:hypothetical protein
LAAGEQHTSKTWRPSPPRAAGSTAEIRRIEKPALYLGGDAIDRVRADFPGHALAASGIVKRDKDESLMPLRPYFELHVRPFAGVSVCQRPAGSAWRADLGGDKTQWSQKLAPLHRQS